MGTVHTRPGEEVSANNVTETGTLVSAACRVRGIYVRSGGTAGSVELKDGGASGTSKLIINTPAVVEGIYNEIPGGGIVFGTDVHATLTQADGVTVYYVPEE